MKESLQQVTGDQGKFHKNQDQLSGKVPEPLFLAYRATCTFCIFLWCRVVEKYGRPGTEACPEEAGHGLICLGCLMSPIPLDIPVLPTPLPLKL